MLHGDRGRRRPRTPLDLPRQDHKGELGGLVPGQGTEVEVLQQKDAAGGDEELVHRLRRKFQTALRKDIAETVSDPADVNDEIRYLVRALGA